jgi:hypothetical protein
MRIFIVTENLQHFIDEQRHVHQGDYHYAEIAPGLHVVSFGNFVEHPDVHLKEEHGHHVLPALIDPSPVDEKLLAKLPLDVGAKATDNAFQLAHKLHKHTKFLGVRPSLYR